MISSVLKDLLLHLDKGITELLSSLRRSLAASNIMFPSCSIGFRSVCGPGGGVSSFILQEVSGARALSCTVGSPLHRCSVWRWILPSIVSPCQTVLQATWQGFSRSRTSRYQCCSWTYGPAQLSSVLLGVRWETQQTWQWEIGPPVQPL